MSLPFEPLPLRVALEVDTVEEITERLLAQVVAHHTANTMKQTPNISTSS